MKIAIITGGTKGIGKAIVNKYLQEGCYTIIIYSSDDESAKSFRQELDIKYKDKYFQLFADKVSRNAVLADSYMIWTNSEQLAQEYIFEKKEQFVFIKYITRKEIGAVKIVKTPVLDFKDIEQSEEIIEGDALDSWLSELI